MPHDAPTDPRARDCRRREFLSGLAVLTAGPLFAGCGTIMYPDRVGQPAGPLDWKVVALDTVGLLFFLVPGVIAFAVDFYNGTIYLPPDEIPTTSRPVRLSRKVRLPENQRNLRGVQEVVSREAEVQLNLQPGNYLTCKLPALADAPHAASKLEREWKLRG